MAETVTRNTEKMHKSNPFEADVGVTPLGSVRIRITPANPQERFGGGRKLVAAIYDLAAALERKSDEVGARWVVCPDAFNWVVNLELVEEDEETEATALATAVLDTLGFVAKKRGASKNGRRGTP